MKWAVKGVFRVDLRVFGSILELSRGVKLHEKLAEAKIRDILSANFDENGYFWGVISKKTEL